jgi:hypothetical protein
MDMGGITYRILDGHKDDLKRVYSLRQEFFTKETSDCLKYNAFDKASHHILALKNGQPAGVLTIVSEERRKNIPLFKRNGTEEIGNYKHPARGVFYVV